MPNNRRDNVHS